MFLPCIHFAMVIEWSQTLADMIHIRQTERRFYIKLCMVYPQKDKKQKKGEISNVSGQKKGWKDRRI